MPKPKKKKIRVVFARLDTTDETSLRLICRLRGVGRSELLRSLIREEAARALSTVPGV